MLGLNNLIILFNLKQQKIKLKIIFFSKKKTIFI